jgi:hypothetical protein
MSISQVASTYSTWQRCYLPFSKFWRNLWAVIVAVATSPAAVAIYRGESLLISPAAKIPRISVFIHSFTTACR